MERIIMTAKQPASRISVVLLTSRKVASLKRVKGKRLLKTRSGINTLIILLKCRMKDRNSEYEDWAMACLRTKGTVTVLMRINSKIEAMMISRLHTHAGMVSEKRMLCSFIALLFIEGTC